MNARWRAAGHLSKTGPEAINPLGNFCSCFDGLNTSGSRATLNYWIKSACLAEVYQSKP